jgi:tight adherence protein C
MVIIITLAAFAIVTGVVLSGFYWATAESTVSRRLRTLVPETQVAGPLPRAEKKSPSLLSQAVGGLGRYGFAGSESAIRHRLSYAGIRSSNSVMLFLGIRTLLSFGPALIVLVPRVSTGRPLGGTLFTAVLVWAIGHIFVNLMLRQRAARRIRQVTNGLPDTLDLMTTCLEAGLGLNATIARVGEERASLNDPLGREFALVSLELRSGRTREDALRGLGDRNGVEDLKALAGLIIQSDRLGASMSQTLRAHADLLRTKRRQRAEEAARKLPIKMLFPLALFILPALFIVIGGPAILRVQDLVAILLG